MAITRESVAKSGSVDPKICAEAKASPGVNGPPLTRMFNVWFEPVRRTLELKRAQAGELAPA
jgi:hypothetical protein